MKTSISRSHKSLVTNTRRRVFCNVWKCFLLY